MFRHFILLFDFLTHEGIIVEKMDLRRWAWAKGYWFSGENKLLHLLWLDFMIVLQYIINDELNY